MAMPSPINPLNYIVERQYRDSVFIKTKLFKERLAQAKNLYRKDLLAHYGCVNAIEFSRDGEYLISGGDDKRILLWSLAAAMYDKGAPLEMRYTHMSNIFCLAFDSRNEHIFSGGNDDQVLIHEVDSRKLKLIIGHNKPVYGISIHPQNDSILTTAGEDGRILLFDIRASSLHDVNRVIVAEQSNGFHSVMFNPMNPKLVVTANSEEGIALWDTRKPQKHLIHYDAKSGKTSGISASFDSSGKQIIALRRRLPPVLYGTDKENALCQFYHPQYYNSCTMKTCCFAGEDDNYILSGSDDFNLYMWKVPKDDSEWGTSHLVLRGHRSIVNQVRYNQHNHLFASSGVEKMVKLWGSIPMSNWKGSIEKEFAGPTRPIYSHEDYVGLRISHDYSDHSMVEDAKMMAFFDSLIQREIEGWDSTSDGSWTDGDSDEEQDWAEVATRIYRTDKSYQEPRKTRPNRITQLIMKKRNKLAKLAHSKSSSYVRRKTNRQNQKEKNSRSRLCHTRTNGCPDKPWATPNLKRKKGCSSPKYFTRQSVRHMAEQIGSPDTPSTSTGITGSKNVLYRIVEQDSDEEQSRVELEDDEEEDDEEEDGEVEPQNNLINILPTPLNGTSDIFINVLEVETVPTRNHRNEPPPYNCPLGLALLAKDDDEEEDEEEEEEEDEEEELGLGDHQVDLAPSGNKVELEEEEEEEEEEDEEDEDEFSVELSSDSDFEATYATPKRRCLSGASSADSGCATASSSVKSTMYSSSGGSSRQSCSKEQESDNEASKFTRQLKNMRTNNLKRKINADSDSN